MLHRRNFLGGTSCFVVALVSNICAAQEYKITLSRPDTVGQSYTIALTGQMKQSSTFQLPNAPAKKQAVAFTVQISGTVKVLAVDATHSSTKVEFTVGKCLRDDKPLFDPGTLITAEAVKGRAVFTVNGVEVKPDAAAALEMAINPHQPGQPTDGEIFGTDQMQKVGGTWPINTTIAAQEATSHGLPMKPEDVKGQAKLVAVKTVNGQETLQVDAEMDVSKISGPIPTGKIDSGTSTGRFSGIFPNDATSNPISQSQSVHVHLLMTLDGPNNQHASVVGDLERSSKIVYGEVSK